MHTDMRTWLLILHPSGWTIKPRATCASRAALPADPDERLLVVIYSDSFIRNDITYCSDECSPKNGTDNCTNNRTRMSRRRARANQEAPATQPFEFCDQVGFHYYELVLVLRYAL